MCGIPREDYCQYPGSVKDLPFSSWNSVCQGVTLAEYISLRVSKIHQDPSSQELSLSWVESASSKLTWPNHLRTRYPSLHSSGPASL